MNYKVLYMLLASNFLLANNVYASVKVDEKSNIIKIILDIFVKNHFNDKVSLDVSPISYGNFVSGCEVVSIVNLLNYYGYKVDLNKFYKNYFVHIDWEYKNYKNKETKTIEKAIFGPHPDYAFPGAAWIGSGDNCGFGCFKYAICNSINSFLEKHYQKTKDNDKKKKNEIKYRAVFEEEVSTEDAMSKFVKNGIPVLIWSTQPDDKNVPKEKINKTALKMRKSGGLGNWWFVTFPSFLAGTKYTWTRGEHCSLLIGETDECYKICDPFRGMIYVDKKSLNESRKIFNNQIVYLKEQPTNTKQMEKVVSIVLKSKDKISDRNR